MPNVKFVPSDKKAVIKELKNNFTWAEEAHFCVAYATYSAFDVLVQPITNFLKKGNQLKVLFDIERYVTDPKIIEEFSTIPGDSTCRVFFRTKDERRKGTIKGVFHSKIYIFKNKNKFRILLGSSNFTFPGIDTNMEANILIEGHGQEEIIQNIYEYFDKIWESDWALRPDENTNILTKYKKLYDKVKKRNSKEKKDIETELADLLKEASKTRVLTSSLINNDSVYLLGLIAGGGFYRTENEIYIKYHKGMLNRGTKNEGRIKFVGISDIDLSQKKALEKDVKGIVENLNNLFKRVSPGDNVQFNKLHDYDYRLTITFGKDSKLKKVVYDFIAESSISRKRIIPTYPQFLKKSRDKNLIVSFIRGYSDIRSRISPTDRVVDGYLRVALSFSTGANKFARDIEDVLKSKFSVKHIHYLSGKPRGRETMLRIDPVYLYEQPYKFYSTHWKQLLLRDFAQYNLDNYPKRYL